MIQWRKAAPVSIEGEAAAVAQSEADRLEAEFDQARLKVLIDNNGHAPDA